MTLAGSGRRGRKNAAPHGDGREERALPDPGALLRWYDRERRELPWRARPGETADPYRVWLSEIMLQQTRVETVARYYERFLERFPTVDALASARLDAVLKLWAGLGYYARARNLHACAREVAKRYSGVFPSEESELLTLPGIGAYTAAAVAAIAFDRRAAPVDGNVERVVARLFAVEAPMPAAKPELRALSGALVPERRAGDFAQAMMDLGATVCTPRRPDCRACPWRDDCAAHARGEQENFPRRTPKAEGRLRRGAAFFVQRADGAVLVRRRAPKGLLGGMIEIPGTDWSADFELSDVPLAAERLLPLVAARDWRRLPGLVRHVFTHFPLELTVFAAEVPRAARAPRAMRFAPLKKLDGEALPALMRKVVAHALDGR